MIDFTSWDYMFMYAGPDSVSNLVYCSENLGLLSQQNKEVVCYPEEAEEDDKENADVIDALEAHTREASH
jgi:hypothetical protein